LPKPYRISVAVIVVLLLLFLICPCTVHAADASAGSGLDAAAGIDEALGQLDFNDMDSTLQKNADTYGGLSFQQLVGQAVSGQLNLSPGYLVGQLSQMLFRELYQNAGLIRSLVLIALLGAVLKCLTESFKSKSAGELGFYVSYIALIIVLFSSFKLCVDIMLDAVGGVAALMEAALPLIIQLIVLSGGVTSASVFSPLVLFMTNAVTGVVYWVAGPLLIMAAVLQIVNYLMPKDMLSKLSELIRDGLRWLLKAMTGLFLGVLSLQKISAPILDRAAVKTASSVAGAIPVVGDIVTGAVQSVAYWVSAAKSGVLVAIVVAILLAGLVPVIKLLAMVLVYKSTAALIQPLCEDKITECIDAIGSFAALLLGFTVMVMIMFLFAVMILLSF